MQEHKVYTVTEVADILKVSNKTVYNIIHAGDLHAVWVRGQVRITSQALEHFLEGGQHG